MNRRKPRIEPHEDRPAGARDSELLVADFQASPSPSREQRSVLYPSTEEPNPITLKQARAAGVKDHNYYQRSKRIVRDKKIVGDFAQIRENEPSKKSAYLSFEQEYKIGERRVRRAHEREGSKVP